MAVVSEDHVSGKEVAQLFNDVVIDGILDGVYHAGNIPMDGVYQCIPTDILGTLSSIPRAKDVGPSGTACDALQLYNELVRFTTALTRVGSFTWVRTYNTNGNIAIQNQMSGRALFSSAYVRTLADVDDDHGIKSENGIKAFDIQTLMAKLIDAWENTDRYVHNERLDLCHSVCHVVCHSDCDCYCECYK